MACRWAIPFVENNKFFFPSIHRWYSPTSREGSFRKLDSCDTVPIKLGDKEFRFLFWFFANDLILLAFAQSDLAVEEFSKKWSLINTSIKGGL